MKRVSGLDSLRFILAFIVLLGHGGMPHVNENLAASSKLFYCLDILQKVLQPVGVAAVMGFFIISGFVIHFPYSSGKKLNVPEFYARRFIRIAIPAIVAFCIYHFTYGLYMGIVWSLICELIYYLLYPAILKYKAKYMRRILAGAFIASYVVTILFSIFSVDYNGDVHRQGFLWTWIVCLPVWLLGIVLADQYDMLQYHTRPSLFKINLLRISVWLAADVAAILRFQGHIAYGYILPVFSILAYHWIKWEILYHIDRKEYKILRFGGEMSYSLYLIHALILFMVARYTNTELFHTTPWYYCLMGVALSLIASLIFYIAVEKPSHKLARIAGNKL
jgi:peptidoglycan/LPS O-acetylase OafA/YrhL